MPMDWSNERYVRVYTRDTADWLALSTDAQDLLLLLLRKADRSGVIDCGRHGKMGAAIVIGRRHLWENRYQGALEELLADGCLTWQAPLLVFKNYIAAQEAPSSDAQRKRESRERRRASALVTNCDTGSQNVTSGHENLDTVTAGHDPSQVVTSGHSVPYRTVPSRTVPAGVGALRAPATPTEPQGQQAGPQARLFTAAEPEPPKEKQPKKRLTDDGRLVAAYRQQAEQVLDAMNLARRELNKQARDYGKTEVNLVPIAKMLDRGETVESCLHVIAVYKSEARAARSMKWFNNDTPWVPANFRRALGQIPGDKGPAQTPEERQVAAGDRRRQLQTAAAEAQRRALAEALEREGA